MRREQGFALVAVLLVLALLGVVGAEFSVSMRLEASAVRAYKDALIGGHLAEAGIEQAIREMIPEYIAVGMAKIDDVVALTFVDREGKVRPRLPRDRVRLGEGEFTYEITDEEGRLNLNTASPDRVDRLLTCLGLDEKGARDKIVASIQDWRDGNEDHRANGAESEDTYLKRPVPYRSRNGNLESVHELLQINGVTRQIYEGEGERRGLAGVVAVKSAGTVNMNTADPAVLCALNLAPVERNLILQSRLDTVYTTVPGQFGARGLATTSRTFRIEAKGIVGGRVGATITAVVQKREGGEIAFVEWSGVR